MIIRQAEEKDYQALIDIRNFYVLNTHSLFESEATSLDERRGWFESFKSPSSYKLLVAETNGKIAGYTCVAKFRDGEWFSKTAEVSVFCSPEYRKQGIGTKLFEELFKIVDKNNFHSAVSAIALPNEPSILLHKKFGFDSVGTYKEYAFKNGQYISSIIMQKML